MPIPRDITCWHCQRGDHERCGIPRTCACRTCYPHLFTERGHAVLHVNVQSHRFEICRDDSSLHTSRPFYIVELGHRLPIMFSTRESAERQAQMMALGPQPSGDEISRLASHYRP